MHSDLATTNHHSPPMTEPENAHLLAEFHALERQLEALRGRLTPAHRSAPSLGECDVLSCRADGKALGFPLAHIERVLPMASLAPIPEAPPWMLGMLNLHGESLPVLDVARRLDGQPRDAALTDLILVSRRSEGRVGLAVPEVDDVIRIDAGAATGNAGELSFARFLLGMVPVNNEQLYLLNVRALASMAVGAGDSINQSKGARETLA